MLKFVDLHKSKNINNIPPNKTLTKQVFYSTKRKRTSKVRLGKPTINEKSEILSLLSKTKLKDELSELQYLHAQFKYNIISKILVQISSKYYAQRKVSTGPVEAIRLLYSIYMMKQVC